MESNNCTDLKTFKALFTKLWMATQNRDEPKGKAEVYHSELKEYPARIVKSAMDWIQYNDEGFPKLEQLRRRCREKKVESNGSGETPEPEPTPFQEDACNIMRKYIGGKITGHEACVRLEEVCRKHGEEFNEAVFGHMRDKGIIGIFKPMP